ncbi:unnamed protein product [Paramecium pentaurelia]|uniref:Uncharacterized protein n=1 Tax=Paramecium pentaurelia TaxID=43138 RepID=A0A8S1U237_9CILI|nr:unnamed protein product [Paramecium pentaurelia]
MRFHQNQQMVIHPENLQQINLQLKILELLFMLPQKYLNHQYDQKCDFYSLRIILHALLFGNPSFAGRTFHQELERIKKVSLFLRVEIRRISIKNLNHLYQNSQQLILKGDYRQKKHWMIVGQKNTILQHNQMQGCQKILYKFKQIIIHKPQKKLRQALMSQSSQYKKKFKIFKMNSQSQIQIMMEYLIRMGYQGLFQLKLDTKVIKGIVKIIDLIDVYLD